MLRSTMSTSRAGQWDRLKIMEMGQNVSHFIQEYVIFGHKIVLINYAMTDGINE